MYDYIPRDEINWLIIILLSEFLSKVAVIQSAIMHHDSLMIVSALDLNSSQSEMLTIQG